MTGIYVLLVSPNTATSSVPGQEPTRLAAYYHEALEGETLNDTVNRVLTPEHLGCGIHAVDAEHVIEYRMDPRAARVMA